jgi:iron complex outermembrane receptor protein
MKRLLLLIVALAISIYGYAQNDYTLKGKVTNAQDGKPIADVNLVLMPIKKGTITASDGTYIISEIPKGKYILSVTFMGYKKFEKEIAFEKDNIVNLSIALEKGDIMMPPTPIVAKPPMPLEHITTKIEKVDLNATANRDIGDYIRLAPGVSGVRKGGSSVDPAIRGYKFFQVTTFVDEGVMIPGGCPNRMDPTASHIEVDDIQGVEIIKGPHALKYGIGFGGYVHLMTSKPEPFETKDFEVKIKGMKSYESNWNGNKDYINVKFGNNKTYFNFAGANAQYGNYKDGNGDVVRSQYHKYGFSAEMGYKPTKKSELLISYNQSYNRDGAFPALPMDERIDNTDLLAVNFKMMKVSPRIMAIKAKFFQANVFHEMDNKEREFADTVVSISQVDAMTRGFGAGTMIKTGEKSTLMIGAGLMQMEKFGERTKIYWRMPPVVTGVPQKVEVLMDATIRNQGSFFEYKNKFGLTNFIAAGRLDLNMAESTSPLTLADVNGDSLITYEKSTFYQNISLSLGIERPLKNNFAFSVYLGRGVRPPNMLERFLQLLPVGYDNFDYVGRPDILPEANHQLDVSLTNRTEDLGNFSVTGFYSVITNFISSQVLPPSVIPTNSIDVLGVKIFTNVDLAYFRGFEFTYSSPAKYNFRADIGAAYTRATVSEGLGWNADAQGNPAGTVSIKDDNLEEIPPFEATLRMLYYYKEGKFVPRTTIRFVADQNQVSQSYNERTTPGFIVADASFSYRHNSNLTINAGVANLFDKAYFEHLNRRIIGSIDCENCRLGNLYEPGRSFFVNMVVTFDKKFGEVKQ